MRRSPSALLALLAVLGLALLADPAMSQAPPSPRRISPGQAATDLGAIVNDLAEARTLSSRINDAGLRGRIDLLLARAELNARTLREKLGVAATAASPVVEPVMTPEKFAEFLAALKKNAFDPGKAQFITDFARSHRFTCDQAVTLLKEFAFDPDRVKAAVALYPRLVDPGDFYKALDTFAFENGRQAVRKGVGLR
jgi:hypothetical protein